MSKIIELDIEIPAVAVPSKPDEWRNNVVIDDEGRTHQYLGTAPNGSSEDAPVWTIITTIFNVSGTKLTRTRKRNKIWSEYGE